LRLFFNVVLLVHKLLYRRVHSSYLVTGLTLSMPFGIAYKLV